MEIIENDYDDDDNIKKEKLLRNKLVSSIENNNNNQYNNQYNDDNNNKYKNMNTEVNGYFDLMYKNNNNNNTNNNTNTKIKHKGRYWIDNAFKIEEKKIKIEESQQEEERKVNVKDIDKFMEDCRKIAEENEREKRKQINTEKGKKTIISFNGKTQIYNLNTNTFKESDFVLKNYKPSSVLVNIDNDVIFSCGGVNKELFGEPSIDDCFYYDYNLDPSSSSSSPSQNVIKLPPLRFSRSHHTATKINGNKVLVAGGYDQPYTYYASFQIIDLQNRNSIECGNMKESRTHHTSNIATSSSGEDIVWICGGMNSKYHKTTEYYYPTTGKFFLGPEMNLTRSYHSATVLEDGRLMIFGGTSREPFMGCKSAISTEFLDVREGKFVNGPLMKTRRFGHFSILLPNGNVLLGGNGLDNDKSTKSTDIFNPIANKFENSIGPQLIYDYKYGCIL